VEAPPPAPEGSPYQNVRTLPTGEKVADCTKDCLANGVMVRVMEDIKIRGTPLKEGLKGKVWTSDGTQTKVEFDDIPDKVSFLGRNLEKLVIVVEDVVPPPEEELTRDTELNEGDVIRIREEVRARVGAETLTLPPGSEGTVVARGTGRGGMTRVSFSAHPESIQVMTRDFPKMIRVNDPTASSSLAPSMFPASGSDSAPPPPTETIPPEEPDLPSEEELSRSSELHEGDVVQIRKTIRARTGTGMVELEEGVQGTLVNKATGRGGMARFSFVSNPDEIIAIMPKDYEKMVRKNPGSTSRRGTAESSMSIAEGSMSLDSQGANQFSNAGSIASID